jgi:hypothetical protein
MKLIEECFFGEQGTGYTTMQMLKKPITPLSRLIGHKWFTSTERLAEQSGVGLSIVQRALEGIKIASPNERKLRAVLERL